MGINGERLKELRLSKGMNPSDMANLLGISRPAYLKYENGQTKTPRKIEELAKYFNVSTDYLFGNDTPAPAATSTSPHSKRDMDDLPSLTPKESSHLQKYRALDDDGRALVDGLLDTLHEQRSSKFNTSSDETTAS